MAELLREPTAAPLVQWFEASIKAIPEAPCHVAFNTGLVYAYYGEFAQARARLNSVAWSTKPPYLAGMGTLLESLLDYLELHADERGHERAHQARRLMETARGLPGSTLARAGQDVFVLIGAALRQPDASEAVTALEGHFARLPLLIRPLIAWALASAYQQQGQHERAAAMRAFLAASAPHCRGLTPRGP